jgi:hypothetical protein
VTSFAEAKARFDREHATSRTVATSLVPVDGSIRTNLVIRNETGTKLEEYYKWQFIYALVYSGLYPKDYLGVEIRFPKGDVIFGAEGFEKGRTLIVIDDFVRTITNIHGIVFRHAWGGEAFSIYVGCFLGYLRKVGLVDAVAAGGSGGSLAIGYLKHIPVPMFPVEKMKEIGAEYSRDPGDPELRLSRETYLEWHRIRNTRSGLWEVDKSMKALQADLLKIQDAIIAGEPV